MADLIHETNERLVVRKWIPATREEVFAAWNDPESIQRRVLRRRSAFEAELADAHP